VRRVSTWLFAILFLVPTTAVHAEKMFAVDASIDALYEVNVDTGECVLIGPAGMGAGYTTPVSLACRPDDALLFLTNNSPAGVAGLSTLDSETGLATYIGGDVDVIAFDSQGKLYTLAAFNQLATVDPATGIPTLLDGSILPRLFGLDFNHADGDLYGLTGGIDGKADLVRVRTTGALVSTTPLSINIGSVPGALAFTQSGRLLGTNIQGEMFDIDVVTGEVTNVISVTAGFAPQGLARMPACPLQRLVAKSRHMPFGWYSRLNEGIERRIVQDVRTFRDRVLRQTHEGTELAAMYYQHQSEINRILIVHPALAANTLKLVLNSLPCFDAASNEPQHCCVFDRTEHDRGKAILEEFKQYGSDEFRMSVNSLDMFLRQRTRVSGQTVTIQFGRPHDSELPHRGSAALQPVSDPESILVTKS
jgi:hypothetical protein